MTFWIVTAFFLGFVFGYFICCLMVMASRQERYEQGGKN
jgi:hypothetical protein